MKGSLADSHDTKVVWGSLAFVLLTILVFSKLVAAVSFEVPNVVVAIKILSTCILGIMTLLLSPDVNDFIKLARTFSHDY